MPSAAQKKKQKLAGTWQSTTVADNGRRRRDLARSNARKARKLNNGDPAPAGGDDDDDDDDEEETGPVPEPMVATGVVEGGDPFEEAETLSVENGESLDSGQEAARPVPVPLNNPWAAFSVRANVRPGAVVTVPAPAAEETALLAFLDPRQVADPPPQKRGHRVRPTKDEKDVVRAHCNDLWRRAKLVFARHERGRELDPFELAREFVADDPSFCGGDLGEARELISCDLLRLRNSEAYRRINKRRTNNKTLYSLPRLIVKLKPATLGASRQSPQ